MAFWIVYVVAVLFSTSAVHGITSTVNKRNAAIGVSNPLPSKSSGNEGDLKGGESRFSNPEPEYYKGPVSSSTILDRERDRYGLSRPDPVEHRYGSSSSGGFLTSPYDGGHATRYPPSGSSSNTNGYRDKLSFGHYGHSGAGYGVTGTGGGLNYDQNRGQYGPPQVVDYPAYNPAYNPAYGPYEGPNVYGGGNDYGVFGGKQLSKEHLLPLAGAALLGIAAVLVANPMLLQLGVVSGKRKRRDTTNTASASQTKYSQKLAYNGHR